MSIYYNNQAEEGKDVSQKESVYLPAIQSQPQPSSNNLDVGLKRTVPWLEDNRETKTPKTDEKNQGKNLLIVLLCVQY